MSMEAVESKIIAWLQNKVKEAGCKGLVVGLSGGIDSAVVGALCKKAFPNSTLGVMMPCFSHGDDLEHARLVAKKFDIGFRIVDIKGTFEAVYMAIEGKPFEESKRGMEVANLKPRLRMAVLYYFANKMGYLVVGTDNKSEEYAGYFTKYGDGGVDILPIASLLKRDVRKLAAHLGVPKEIIDKAPTAGLWPGQTDEGEMGITYNQLDEAIEAIEQGDTSAIEPRVMERVSTLIRVSQHKREMPPMCKLGGE